MSAKRGVTVVVLNGRLSAGSLRVYLLFRPLFSRVLRGVKRFFVQTESDSAAYQKLGVEEERISVTGTMKSDVSVRYVDKGSLMSDYGVPDEARVLVAGSVRPDEEKGVLEAVASVAEAVPSAYFIVAPRHLQRAPGMAALAGELGLRVRFRSSDSAYSGERLLILDTMGELSAVYGLSHVSFVGGSLKPYGGHNVLEPAMWSVPVLFGKYTGNCSEEAEELVSSRGGMRVADSGDLASAALLLLTDHQLREAMGKNAREVVERRAGVSERVYRELRSCGLLGEGASE
jgi:3-deoxy-D-manno-octulosonic-acid transferase